MGMRMGMSLTEAWMLSSFQLDAMVIIWHCHFNVTLVISIIFKDEMHCQAKWRI